MTGRAARGQARVAERHWELTLVGQGQLASTPTLSPACVGPAPPAQPEPGRGRWGELRSEGGVLLPWGSWPSPEALPRSPNMTQTGALPGQLVSLGTGWGQEGSALCHLVRWARGQPAGVPAEGGGSTPSSRAEKGCAEPGPAPVPPRPPPVPCPSRPWGSPPSPLSPARPRSLRMPRGRSARRPPLRTGRTCTCCRSPKSRCPWPGSPGAQVSRAARDAAASAAGAWWAGGLLRGPPSARSWGAVSRLGDSPAPIMSPAWGC